MNTTKIIFQFPQQSLQALTGPFDVKRRIHQHVQKNEYSLFYPINIYCLACVPITSQFFSLMQATEAGYAASHKRIKF